MQLLLSGSVRNTARSLRTWMSEAGDAGQRLKRHRWVGVAYRQWLEQRGVRSVPFERASESLKSRSHCHRRGNASRGVDGAGEKMSSLDAGTH